MSNAEAPATIVFLSKSEICEKELSNLITIPSKPPSLIKIFDPAPNIFMGLISLISLKGESINAEYFEELHIDNTTKTEDDASAIPNNPFEIVEMIRRYNSLNDATNPSDAIDDALNSFYDSDEK